MWYSSKFCAVKKEDAMTNYYCAAANVAQNTEIICMSERSYRLLCAMLYKHRKGKKRTALQKREKQTKASVNVIYAKLYIMYCVCLIIVKYC